MGLSADPRVDITEYTNGAVLCVFPLASESPPATSLDLARLIGHVLQQFAGATLVRSGIEAHMSNPPQNRALVVVLQKAAGLTIANSPR